MYICLHNCIYIFVFIYIHLHTGVFAKTTSPHRKNKMSQAMYRTPFPECKVDFSTASFEQKHICLIAQTLPTKPK